MTTYHGLLSDTAFRPSATFIHQQLAITFQHNDLYKIVALSPVYIKYCIIHNNSSDYSGVPLLNYIHPVYMVYILLSTPLDVDKNKRTQ